MSKALQIIAFPLVALLATPVLMLVVWIGHPVLLCMMIVYVRRLRKAVRTFGCVHCGQSLGLDSLALAGKECSRRDPDSIDCCRMLEHTLDAICPNCGARYSFEEGRLVLESERLDP